MYRGCKQVFRGAAGDRLGLMSEAADEGERGLLACVMRGGERLAPVEDISAIAARTAASVAALPRAARELDCDRPARPAISEELQALADSLPQ